MAMSIKMRFQPISFSWVAIHPEPKGVIQFMGGAFFGSLPTLFYRHFLQSLFAAGYTIVALPFRFSFQHWAIALDLLQEQQVLRQTLIELTGNPLYQESANYCWIGHSLGCKYIALLELLSGEAWLQHADNCLPQPNDPVWTARATRAKLKQISILNQPALLIAPDISDTESAIPIPVVARWLDRLRLGVSPTRSQTQCLIERSALFNLTALISFTDDHVAGIATAADQDADQDASQDTRAESDNDVFWLVRQLAKRQPLLHQALPGRHLAPLGIKIGAVILGFSPGHWLELAQSRLLERYALNCIEQLRQRQAKSHIFLRSPDISDPVFSQLEIGVKKVVS